MQEYCYFEYSLLSVLVRNLLLLNNSLLVLYPVTMKLCVIFVSLLATALAAEVTTEHTKRHSCIRKTKRGDKISVHYRGTLADTGVKFDASYDRNRPLTFTVGQGQVIKGWDEGLLDMCPGDKRVLTIPPEFGYGDRAMGPIPAGSTLSTWKAGENGTGLFG